MQISCEGRRAVVTAGGSGIGRVIAETLAANGAQVFTCDVEPGLVDEVRERGIGACLADVGDPRSRRAAVRGRGRGHGRRRRPRQQRRHRRPHRAGGGDRAHRLGPHDRGQHLRPVLLRAPRGAADAPRPARGAIVNISSTAGRMGFPLRLPYATSKFAITGLTKTLALELGPANISVNAILPGYILNARGERVIRAKAEAAGRTVDEMQATILRNIAMRTGITEQEIADLALYLCSPSPAATFRASSSASTVPSTPTWAWTTSTTRRRTRAARDRPLHRFRAGRALHGPDEGRARARGAGGAGGRARGRPARLRARARRLSARGVRAGLPARRGLRLRGRSGRRRRPGAARAQRRRALVRGPRQRPARDRRPPRRRCRAGTPSPGARRCCRPPSTAATSSRRWRPGSRAARRCRARRSTALPLSAPTGRRTARRSSMSTPTATR